VYVAGREDFESRRFEGFARKSVNDILTMLPNTGFVIMMDHQPIAINEAAQSNVGLLLCGHTHHGQLWPLNYLTGKIFQLSHGLKRFGNTWVYVSNGVGSWGPPVRIGNRPEIVEITLSFQAR